jgi:hypothetical protein
MPDTLYPPSRPQSVGEILDAAFRIFSATVLKCLPLAGLALVAGQLPNIYYLAKGGVAAMVGAAYQPLWWVLYIIGYVITVLLWSLILLRQYAVAARRSAPDSEPAAVLRRAPVIVLTWILVLIAVAIWFVPAGMLHGAGMVGAALLLAIPATYVFVRLSASWVALLLTGKGATASLNYSWLLTAGSFWRLSLIYTVGVILLFVLYVLWGFAAMLVALPFARGDLAVATAVSTVVVVILGAIGTPFYIALALAVFGDLTVRREGADLAQRISATVG